jgi:hypothetical protein
MTAFNRESGGWNEFSSKPANWRSLSRSLRAFT